MNRDERNFWFKLGVAIALLIFALSALGYVLGWFGSAAKVVKDEFGPEAAIQKYEWFINTANDIKKADQDVAIFEKRRADVEAQFTTYGADKTKWPPSIQAQYNQAAQTARDDLVAIVSNRNGLVRDYNAQSQKFNWTPFQTRPDLPPPSYFEYVMK